MKKISSCIALALALIFSGSSFSQNLDRGPYLQMGTPTSIVIKWRTTSPAESKVRYGLDPNNLTSVVSKGNSTSNHSVHINGLMPSTKYYYSIETSTTVLQGNNENHFITAPPVGTIKPTRIWVIGDAGTNYSEQNQVRDAYYNYTGSTPTDIWLWLGDNAYKDGKDSEYQTNVFTNHYERMFKQTVAWPAAGNHDLRSASASDGTGPYYDIFTLPKNGEAGGVPSGTEAFYSFDYTNIHFVCLESTTSSFREKNGTMANWLKNDLAANNQKFTIVYFHHPPYTKGSHDSDTEVQLIEMRENITPILEEYNVDLVLTGHSHAYERSTLINGHYGKSGTFNSSMQVDAGSGTMPSPYLKKTKTDVGTVYAVAGCSGKLSHISSGWPHKIMHYATNTVYGSMVIDIHGDTLNAKFIDNSLNPEIKDEFTIIKESSTLTGGVESNNSTISDETGELKIFPNPSKGLFNLTFKSSALTREEVTIEIVNSIGQVVYKNKPLIEEDGTLDEEVVLSPEFAAGVYVVQLKVGSETYNTKMMITK